MPYKYKEDKKKYHKEYHAKWYAENRQKIKRKMSDRRSEIRQWFEDYKSTLKCNRCNECHPATLDFHHINHKNKEVSILVSEGCGKELILAEISLCEVLCSNCHRKEHWNKQKTISRH